MDGEKPVAERVGDLLDAVPLCGRGVAWQQLDAPAAVEARAYLVVLHLTPPPGNGRRPGGRHAPRSSHARESSAITITITITIA
ncbi:hypothetical protein ABZZ17_37530 [Streptomyces sp. NPDC006512]|uniref:hypothetical protein n=1 Tax=Streptomyces sp. NPDC006512 TaxID=3154307 RepID=UPI0033A0FA14